MIDSAHVSVRFRFMSRRRRDDARRRVDERRTSNVGRRFAKKRGVLGFGQSRVQTSRFRKSSENRRSEDVGKARAAAVVRGGAVRARAVGTAPRARSCATRKNPTRTSSVNSSALVMGPSHPPFCNPTISSVSTAAAASEIWKRSEAITEACRLMAASFTASHAGNSPRDARAATETRRPGAARRALSGAVARRRGRRPPAERLTAVGATAAPASAATTPAATGMGLRFVKSPRQMDEHGEVRRERGRSRRRAAVDVHTTWPSAATLRG